MSKTGANLVNLPVCGPAPRLTGPGTLEGGRREREIAQGLAGEDTGLAGGDGRANRRIFLAAARVLAVERSARFVSQTWRSPKPQAAAAAAQHACATEESTLRLQLLSSALRMLALAS